MERTLIIVKPDAVGKNFSGDIIKRFENNGFKLSGAKFIKMDKKKAEGFYYVHKERPFFGSLVDFMTSGPVFVISLKKDNAVKDARKLIGATNPSNAEAGTIRKDFAESIERNAIHGSDSTESAQFEVGYFFKAEELL
ncbi:MAG: nucleoside-diphosphate kinase [bacterium]|nr:nucleoside-diphosphate kinase [bacterium]